MWYVVLAVLLLLDGFYRIIFVIPQKAKEYRYWSERAKKAEEELKRQQKNK